MKHHIFIVFGAFLLMSATCNTTKVITQKTPTFEVMNAYIQKNIPGERGQQPYMEFDFEIKGLDSTTIDSVFCGVGKSVRLTKNGKQRIQLSYNSEADYREATFYCTQEKNRTTYLLNTITRKEDIYLP